ncbi:DUF4384 domain-containing protein [Falsiroseomonas stagni]|uniref:DUF4384 domain-containing protein n=1 Tax=Falsiroseomonas stagni DSM 19981 TaxID=1123062 RepID=A0A1I4FI15_9PROT|nr:DUF4384 domain-containing protein [Falsiroseomonas stagni]SFL16091.1 protein of unknown function [Falsiroseomonas stagni DSM 19981]
MTRPLRTLALAGCGWLALLGFAHAQGETEEALSRDLTINQRPVYQFVQQQQQAQAQRPPQLRVPVAAWTDRVDATFRIGEPVAINVRPEREAHITVLNIGSSGRATVLFPNQFQRDSRVRAGQVLTLGGPGAGYNIVPQGPAGVEMVHVVASTRPLSVPELTQLAAQPGASPFVSLGRSADEVTRDLAVQATGPTAVAQQASGGMATLLIRVLAQPTVAAPAPAPAATAQSAQLLALLQQLGIPAAAQPAAPVAAPPALAAPAAAVVLPSGFAPPPVVIRTDRSVYRETDAVQITVAALADCRLTLLNIGPTGNVAQLFPNPAQPEALLRAGQVVMVPPPNSGVVIHPRGPSGMETIVGLCAQSGSEPASAPLMLTAQRDLGAVSQAVVAPTPAVPAIASAATVYFVRP